MPTETAAAPLFTPDMLLAISPQLIIAFGMVLSLLLTAWKRSRRIMQALTSAIFIVALFAALPLLFNPEAQVTGLLKVDGYGVFTFILVCFSALMVTLLSGPLLQRHTEAHDEYYLLLQLMSLGGGILVISDHFASLFLGFELLSLSLVGLVGFIRDGRHAVETPFKYLILSATASSFMLLGIAFIYSQTGSLHFSLISATGQVSGELTGTFHALGMLLFFAGLAFKLSLVPFHFWTPDVYQGAPTPVTMLMATASKVAMFTVLMKCLFSQAYFQQTSIMQLVALVAMLSMLFGNVLALKQENLKRLLGYSSIAHMGYILIIVLINQTQSIEQAWQSGLFYLVAYLLACVSIFTVIALTELTNETQDTDLTQWQGLFWRSPLMASLVIVAILSFAGIPLTAGFIGKFYLINVAADQSMWLLLSALIIGSGIALAYYLPMIFALFNEPNEQIESQDTVLTSTNRAMVSLFISFGLILGVFPDILGLWLQGF